MTSKIHLRLARKRRIRSRISGTAARPRMSVHRSLKNLSVQLIDDTAGRTLAAASTQSLKAPNTKEGAKKLGTAIADKAKKAGVETVVFDRNAYRYHGRIKELADAARAGGLKF